MKYRKDIDGLRAIAVLLVVFCHMNIDGFTGGFLGVDIFFVISGFLITFNITEKLTKSTFSFKGFYLNRIKRIAPVLIVILLLLSIFNAFVLLPDALKNYFDFLPFAVVGLGNYAAANLSHGYFDASAERYQLLHTWSLGVEEQFYLVVPILFFLIWKIKSIHSRKILIIMIWLSSIAVSIYFVEFTTEAKSNYYLLHTRFFEIFTGSMLAVFYRDLPPLPSKFLVNFSYIIAIGAIFYLSFYYGDSSLWPGINALIVSLVTAFLLYLGKDNHIFSKARAVLELNWLRLIGKISYSLYLWHWIIIATLVEIGYDMDSFSLFDKISLLVIVMIPLSYLSWRYVENIFRYRFVLKFGPSLVFWVILPLLSSVVLLEAQKSTPSFFYNKSEIDNTSYKFSFENSPHLRIRNSPHSKELRKKFKGSEYFVGDYRSRLKSHGVNELDIKSAEVLILTNSHFHAFKKFINNQLKDKSLVGHVLHEGNPKIYSHSGAEDFYRMLLKDKKFLVLWVRPKMMKLGDSQIDWHFWMVNEALRLGVQPIVYVTGLEMENEQEARKHIYQEKIFTSRVQEIGNKSKLYSNITDLSYIQKLFDTFGTKVRWVDFKPLMCDYLNCQLWSDDQFALFDKHHITRSVGARLGEEYNIVNGNIFSPEWSQPPISIQQDVFNFSNTNQGISESNVTISQKGYNLEYNFKSKRIFIRKEFDSLSDNESMYFFHVFPEDINDLPENRRVHGFENLDVKGNKLTLFKNGKVIFYGKNIIPDYKVKYIKVGHFKPKGKKYFETTL